MADQEKELQQGAEQQNDAGKEEKKYQNAFQLVLGILEGTEGGKSLLKKKRKAPISIVDKVAAKLLKETDEKFEETLKAELENVLSKHIEFENEVAKKEEELKQVKLKGKKAFTEAVNNLMNKIEDRAALQQRYANSLKTALTGGDAAEDQEKN